MADQASRPLSAVTGGSQRASQQLEESHRHTSHRGVSSSPVVSTPKQGRKRRSTANLSHIVQQKKTRSTFTEEPLVTRLFHTRSQELPLTPAESEASDDSSPIACRIKSLNRLARNRSALSISVSPNITYLTRSQNRERLLAFQTTFGQETERLVLRASRKSHDKISKSHKRSSTASSRSTSASSSVSEDNTPILKRVSKSNLGVAFIQSVIDQSTPRTTRRSSKQLATVRKTQKNNSPSTWTVTQGNTINKGLKKVNSLLTNSRANTFVSEQPERRYSLRSYEKLSLSNNNTIATIEKETPLADSANTELQSATKRIKTDTSKNKTSSSTTSGREKHKALNLGARLGRGSREPLETSQGGGSLLRRSTRGEHITMPAPREKKKKDKGKLVASTTGSCVSSVPGGRGGSRSSKGGSAGSQAGPSTSTINMSTGEGADSKGKDGVPPLLTEASGGVPPNVAPNPDSESDDSEVGRLQALLEARGLPPHLFGALGPRMQHLLHRSMGANSSTKAQQLLQGLQAGDESQQLQAVIEMCQMLVMGNEDTLTGFPVRTVVPALITLLGMEHNFDMMNHACRALTYMMEALPRSSAVVVDAVPVFLEKLQVIQCMDVAEQSLTALDMLSRRHSKAILQARGVTSCLMYLDFFSINAQRAALSITSNCCQNLHAEEYHFIGESLSLLAARLTQQDKKSVESVCLAFSRLVDSYQHDPSRLQEMASVDLLTNSQQLLVVSPPIISTGTFITVLRMLSVMCSNCPDLALTLLRQNIADTLLYLLTGSSVPNNLDDIELTQRSPQELYEITCLIGELMPRLPTDGIFAVDAFLEKPMNNIQDTVQWQWKGNRDLWHLYTSVDSRIIEAAYQNSDDEISLSTSGRTYTVDFHAMQQINEDSGTTRPVQRKINTQLLNDGLTSTTQPQNIENSNQSTVGITTLSLSNRPSNLQRDARVACLREERGLASAFIRSLFSVLYEVYSSSAGPSVRCKCLKALLRMVYYANADLLKDVLKNQVVSSHIAGMMASSDLRIVVGSLQMADILMMKLPDVFGVHFRREGVMHHIKQLADPAIPLSVSPPKSANSSVAGSSAQTNLNLPQENTPSGTKISNLTALKLDQIASKHLVTSSKLNNVSNKSSSSSSKSTSSTVTPIASVSTSNNTSLNNSSPLGVSPVNSFLSGQPSGSSLLNSSISPLSGSIGGGNPDSSNTSTNGSVLMGAMTNAGLVYTSAPDAKRYADLLEDDGSQSPSQMRLSDVLKRKRVPKRATLSSRSKSRTEEMNLSSSVMQDLFNKATSLGTAAAGRSTPTGSSSRSRFSGATSKTTSFLASLNPARWGRQAAPHSAGFGKDASSTSLIKSSSNPNLTAGNREKARGWVRNQASKFIEMYSENENSGPPHPALNVLSCLTAAIQKLPLDYAASLSALIELRDILIESDISPFEVNHSGLIRAMINFMASEDGVVTRDDRLRAFLHVFAGCPQRGSYCGPLSTWNPVSFGALVAKLSGCVSQLEQFPVKVHDLPAGTGAGRGGTSALKFFNTHQLKCNLQRHPDCSNLKQWKGGTVKIDPLALVQAIERYLVVRGYGRLRDKDTGESDDDNSEDDIDDTLAAVVISQGGSRHKLQFIMGEQILPYNMTVYQAVRQFSVSGNDQSETDTDTETPLGNAGVWVQTHTIYYRPVPEDAGSSKSLNVQHTTRKGKTSSKTHIRRKGDDLWNEGIVPAHQSLLTPFLSCNLPECVNIQDASLEVLCLLRILHALNRYWGGLYPSVQYMQIIPHTDFINSKIAAKANRQLQDPLVIMTGNLPQWLNQVAAVCPFLFPFETRQLLFYAISFDRDRALQRLLDSTPELSSNDSTERVTPRLDRRKRTISRDDILKQAEAVIQDFANSKALLEVQYENEVGTGLGPTLEFYTLVSLELQRADLDLWHGSESSKQKSNISDVIKSNTFTDNFVGFDNTTLGSSLINTDFRKTDSSLQMLIDTSGVDLPSDPSENLLSNPESDQSPDSVAYVNNPTGLFPMSMGRTTKVSQMSKVKSKFKFLGKFMAKAVMDSRMLDLPFSNAFYRWVLGQENSLSLADLVHVAPEVHKTLVRLQDIVHRRNVIEADTLLNLAEKKQRLDSLDLDGCPIVDLGLDFILPGHATIELRKGGKDTPVTLENLDQYITLVTHWFLYEGVTRQMDAFREGFDSVFPLSHLRMFYPEELEAVFCGANAQSWDARILSECCRTDHGFNQDSRAIKFLFEILSGYNKEEQRMFLQFITGSPRLPTGGFKSLSPPLTIVRKTLEPNMNPDDYLPSVMTCVNYLKLPDYSSIEAMRTKLRIAASEGQHSFHLS